MAIDAMIKATRAFYHMIMPKYLKGGVLTPFQSYDFQIDCDAGTEIDRTEELKL